MKKADNFKEMVVKDYITCAQNVMGHVDKWLNRVIDKLKESDNPIIVKYANVLYNEKINDPFGLFSRANLLDILYSYKGNIDDDMSQAFKFIYDQCDIYHNYVSELLNEAVTPEESEQYSSEKFIDDDFIAMVKKRYDRDVYHETMNILRDDKVFPDGTYDMINKYINHLADEKILQDKFIKYIYHNCDKYVAYNKDARTIAYYCVNADHLAASIVMDFYKTLKNNTDKSIISKMFSEMNL